MLRISIIVGFSLTVLATPTARIKGTFVPCGSSVDALKEMAELTRLAAKSWPEEPAIARVRDAAKRTHSLILNQSERVEVIHSGETYTHVRIVSRVKGGPPTCWVDSHEIE